MPKIEDNIDLVNDKIEDEVNRFLEGVGKSQKGIFNRLLSIVKGVDTDDNGNIKQTVKNLKLLAKIRKTIENEIITEAYIKRSESLFNQFPAIAQLNNGYFETLEASFNPNRELFKEVIKNSVNATRTSLLESGVSENVINPIVNIVDNSVTNGSTFADMVDELRLVIKGDEERLGQLMRYSKQITQDALNQFNASYNETIAKDLDLEWYFYSGGKRRTSRPFCKKYAGRYFHKKEVEDFGKRKDLDGSNLCGGSSKTDLCAGRVKGTNKSNIFRYRGGHNCKHLYKPTLIDSVPKSVVKRNLDKGYINESDLEGITKPNVKKQEPKTIPKKASGLIKTHDEFLNRTSKYLNKNIDQKTQFILNNTEKLTNDNFKGAPIPALNSIARGFDDVLPKFDIELNSIGHAGKGRALGVYFPQVNAIALQKTYLKNANKVSEQTQKAFTFNKEKNIARTKDIINSTRPQQLISQAKNRLGRIEATDKWSISSISKDPIYTTTVHESYHAVDHKFTFTGRGVGTSQRGSLFRDFLDKNNVTETDILKVSEYARTNEAELFAEIGAAINDNVSIPKNIEKAFNETINTVK